MTYNDLMIQSLSALLEPGEILNCPVYGTLMQKGRHWFGFFGLTDRSLLISLLEGSTQTIHWTSRVPLDLKAVKVKKSLLLSQYKVRMEFHAGAPCNIRISKQVYGIETQGQNLAEFLTRIQETCV